MYNDKKSNNKGVTLLYRIYPAQWLTDVQFNNFLKFLENNRNSIDEISLFDESFPIAPGISLCEYEKKIKILTKRIKILKDIGIRKVGINVTHTLGHGDFSKEPLQYQPMIGNDGQISNGSVCPNDSSFRKYINAKYIIAASSNPDFIWIDDDYRMSSHGVMYPCFCPICLKKFGHDIKREELISKLETKENSDLRIEWTEFCSKSLKSLAGNIGKVIRTANPDIEVGLMTVGYSLSTYGTYDIKGWMKILGAKRGRPGHLYYTDHKPRLILNKMMDTSRLINDYPKNLTSIQYELENHPYIYLDKSIQTVINECILSLMSGCNGITFNILRMDTGSLDDYKHYLDRIGLERDTFSKIVEQNFGLPLQGIWPAYNKNLMAKRDIDDNGWFNEGNDYDIQKPNHLMELGIPFTPSIDNACGIILSGKIAESFSKDELSQMLSKGVFMDIDALKVIWKKGLGKLTGVKPGKKCTDLFVERFTEHNINGKYKGDGRYLSQGKNIYDLELTNNTTSQISYLTDFDKNNYGCCLSTYENELGGRIVVSSYEPWQQLGTGAKKHQMLALFDWLTYGKLPIIIKETVRVVPLIKENKNKKLTVVLFNTSLDDTGELTVHIRKKLKNVTLINKEGAKSLNIQNNDNDTLIKVPSIGAWKTLLLIAEIYQ